jgi:hypothetical protein
MILGSHELLQGAAITTSAATILYKQNVDDSEFITHVIEFLLV